DDRDRDLSRWIRAAPRSTAEDRPTTTGRGAMSRALRAMLVGALVVGLATTPGAVAMTAGPPLPVTGITASGDDGNVPANTVDGDPATRWSDEGDGVWIRYDLGSAQVVGSVAIAWHKGDTRKHTFEVQLSGDGSSWRSAVARRSSTGGTLAPEEYDFTDSSARYLRIVGHGNTSNDWTSITETSVRGADGGGGDCRYPADVLDLTDWYVGLPVGEEESPTNVGQPELATYSADPWFRTTPACDGVRFRAAVNGVTTSGSSYPRSELREMSGSAKASWSSTSGTHTMVVDEAITALPRDKPHVVAGQIHDSGDDVSVFRLEGSKLYVTDGDTAHHKLVTDAYVLGTRFQAKFVVGDGRIKAYYNGVLQTTITKSFSGAYFKSGAYTQANCTNSSPCDAGNYGEVEVYRLTVTH
ncbi:polysaccharide lyase family 7 protein, partial [Actinosynnema sp. NPDC023658]|uniref:polysaccharide lyase family 7 protein n=1 Tax=Actinosynnema sp. NPDC023658 TaxID=3155465 RepID=UPI0033F740FA